MKKATWTSIVDGIIDRETSQPGSWDHFGESVTGKLLERMFAIDDPVIDVPPIQSRCYCVAKQHAHIGQVFQVDLPAVTRKTTCIAPEIGLDGDGFDTDDRCWAPGKWLI